MRRTGLLTFQKKECLPRSPSFHGGDKVKGSWSRNPGNDDLDNRGGRVGDGNWRGCRGSRRGIDHVKRT